MRRPAWFWVQVWGQYGDEKPLAFYEGPVLSWNSGSATVRGGNRLRRRFKGITVVATDTRRSQYRAAAVHNARS